MSYVSMSDLQELNGIYIRNITEGMQNYLYCILEGTKEQHYSLLEKLLESGKPHSTFADFYFKRVNPSNIELFRKHLNEEQSFLFDQLVKEGHESGVEEEFLLLELTKEILSLLLHISFEELLFSSFYITKPPCTIWSNYGGRFILFTREQEQYDTIITLAKEIGMQVDK